MRLPRFHIRTPMILVVVAAMLSSILLWAYNVLSRPSYSDPSDDVIRYSRALQVCCPLTLIGMMAFTYWVAQFLRGK